MTLSADWKKPYFELVGDEIGDGGMTLDEAYAFLTGADRLTSEAPRVVVAAATEVRIPRIVLAASDHWKRQPRVPSGEDGGQWTDDPAIDTPNLRKAPKPAKDGGDSPAAKLASSYAGGVEKVEKIQGGLGSTELERLTLKDGTRVFRKRVPTEKQVRREIAAAKILNTLGVDDFAAEQLDDTSFIMSEVEGTNGSDALKKAQADGVSPYEFFVDAVTRPGGREIALLDWLTVNSDRNDGNFKLRSDGEVRSFDHGDAQFIDYGVPSSVFVSYWMRPDGNKIDPRFTAAELADVESRLAALRAEFVEDGNAEWHDVVMKRLHQLQDAVEKPVVAAAEVHTGAMIALVPTSEDARRLALAGFEEPEQLHVTLVYLGEAADLDEEARAAILDVVRRYATAPVTARAFAVNLFNPDGDEPCLVLGIGNDGGPELEQLRSNVYSAVRGLAGAEVPENHTPWIPHITLAYADVVSLLAALPRALERIGPVSFDRIRVAFGGEVTDVPLRAPRIVVAASDHWKKQPRDPSGDDAGQWIAEPDITDATDIVSKIILSGPVSGNPFDASYRPPSAAVEAAQKLAGKDVEISIDFGVKSTSRAKLIDVGEANGMSGLKVAIDGEERFLPWTVVRELEESTEVAPKTERELNPYSVAFAARAEDALTGEDALRSAPYISEDAPISQHWALGSYQAEGYRPTNAALRTGNMDLVAEQNRGEDGIIEVSVRENIRELDRLMKKSRVGSNIIVYRGIRSLKSLGVADIDRSLEGLEWEDPAYTSTSTDRGRALSFIDKDLGDGVGALLRIVVPKGTHGINLGVAESEILLDRGYRYRVLADNGVVAGIHQLDVEVLPK